MKCVEVELIIGSLKPTTAKESVKAIKTIKDKIILPLMHIFNLILETNFF